MLIKPHDRPLRKEAAFVATDATFGTNAALTRDDQTNDLRARRDQESARRLDRLLRTEQSVERYSGRIGRWIVAMTVRIAQVDHDEMLTLGYPACAARQTKSHVVLGSRFLRLSARRADGDAPVI